MSNKLKLGLLAAFAIAATAIPLTVTNAIAQEKTDTQQGVPPPAGPGQQGGFGGQGGGQGGFGGQGGQGGQGGFQRGGQGGQPGFPGGQGGPMMMGGGGGGGTAIVEEGPYLYIVQGNRMFKVNKSDLKVVAQGELPRPMGGPGGGAPPGQPGGGGNRGGGGGDGSKPK